MPHQSKPHDDGTSNTDLGNLDSVKPPHSYMTVTSHKLPGGTPRQPFFYFHLDVAPNESYLAETYVYIPNDFRGSDVSIVFFGDTPVDMQRANLNLRDQWQKLFVTVDVQDGKTQLAPSLVVGTANQTEILSAGWSVTKRKSIPHESVSKTRFEVVGLEDIIRRHDFAADGQPRVTREACLPDVDVPIPAITYGQISAPDVFTEFPANNWKLGAYALHDAAIYTLRNAVVHGEQGIITVGNLIVAESLYLGHLQFMNFEQDEIEKNVYYLSDYHPPDIHVETAAHVMCGYVSNRNYAHWWVNVVPAIMVRPFHDAFETKTLLMPEIRAQWQRDTLTLLPEVEGRTVFVGEHARIACDKLCFIPKVNRSDFEPHPFRKKILGEMKLRAGFGGKAGRRIYISRRDADARKLLNEDEASKVLESYGFETISLTGKPVAEQIRIFSEASHVVSAHGAGLSNIIFCPQDAALCEFQMSSNVQWSIRRLAAVTGMRYGCIVGAADDDSVPVWERNWRINLADLVNVLCDPNFMRAPHAV